MLKRTKNTNPIRSKLGSQGEQARRPSREDGGRHSFACSYDCAVQDRAADRRLDAGLIMIFLNSQRGGLSNQMSCSAVEIASLQ